MADREVTFRIDFEGNAKELIETNKRVDDLIDKSDDAGKSLDKFGSAGEKAFENIGSTARKAGSQIGAVGKSGKKAFEDIDSSVKKTGDSIENLSKSFEKTGKSFTKIGGQIGKTGKELTTKVTLPLAGIGVAGLKANIDFESAMAGVAKTIDMTDTEFNRMSKSIRDMSKEIPATTTEIAGVAEMAGQLGISKENVLGFSRTIIDLGEATNLSAEEGASALAQFANITQMSEKNFSRLGSTIVDLGNNMATTEADIVRMGQRLAGTGSQVGLTESEIMALAAAAGSVGVEADAGGTALSTTMTKINSAVMDGGEKMQTFSNIAGMTAGEFASKWKEKPTEAFTAFVQGLDNVTKSGGNVDSILSDLGISGIRETDTLKRLAGSGNLLSEAFGIAGEAWEENIALSNEAKQRYQTTASRLAILKNRFMDNAITIGDSLLPILEKGMGILEKLTDKFSNLSPESQEAIVKMGLFAATIGPITSIVGKTTQGIGGLFRGLGLLSKSKVGNALLENSEMVKLAVSNMTFKDFKLPNPKALFGGFKKGFLGIGKFIKAKGGILGGFKLGGGKALAGIGAGLKGGLASIAGMATIILPVIAIISVLSGAIFLLANNWDTVKAKSLEFVSSLQTSFASFVPNIKALWENLKTIFLGLLPVLAGILNVVISGIGGFIGIVASSISSVVKVLKGLTDFLIGVFTLDWSRAWNGIKDIFSGVIDTIKGIFEGVMGFFGGIINKFTDGVKVGEETANKARDRATTPNSVTSPKVKGRFATGVRNFSGGLALVGEEGPEIVHLPRGSDVLNNRESIDIFKNSKRFMNMSPTTNNTRSYDNSTVSTNNKNTKIINISSPINITTTSDKPEEIANTTKNKIKQVVYEIIDDEELVS